MRVSFIILLIGVFSIVSQLKARGLEGSDNTQLEGSDNTQLEGSDNTQLGGSDNTQLGGTNCTEICENYEYDTSVIDFLGEICNVTENECDKDISQFITGVCIDICTVIEDNIRGISTEYPTYYPNYSSQYPTYYPSQYPTYYPSQYPTYYPSQYPTYYPSQYPTYYPSQYPTYYPSQYPTYYPSQYPTNYPYYTEYPYAEELQE
ncbi:hypothetical protein LOD99_1154 [Oopsacas minuta]|uniref:Uncharacterized protein n=1 Tax=Oopsacas minuta TaxID=111878 RepID=A0AAV7K5K3_9METZ|nr:hypothetical protein LOD99_1154 [Oopsacas minuta]